MVVHQFPQPFQCEQEDAVSLHAKEALLTGIRNICSYAAEHEDEFVEMVTKKTQDELNKSLRDSQRELEQSQTRIRKLDDIIQRLYEDNIEGKISDEHFMKMNTAYEVEQHTLEDRVAELKSLIASEKKNSANVDAFLSIIRKYPDIQELTPEIIREFVEKIYVYNAECIDGKRVQKIKIIWNCIGEFDVPHERINGAAG